jgi:hypothetical protein
MFLLSVTMDREGNFRPFFCHVPKLEAAFDVLGTITATGDVLISVDLIDNGQRTPLPVEAFDGEPVGTHIKNLEHDWQALLNKPISLKSAHNRLLTGFSRLLHATYQTRIDWLELAIDDTNSRIRDLPHTPHWESCCVRLELQITLYLRQLEQAQIGQRRIDKRFATYLDCD